MTDPVHITLKPLGAVLEVERHAPLQDVLFPYGVEFPCGGRARCKGCRVRVIEGALPVTPEQARILSPEEIGAGWRLACHCSAGGDLVLELAQWEAAILADESNFAFTPREGLGIAVDVGTTTLVAQLLDLRTGNVLAVRTALNSQARHGADIMSRIGYAVTEGGQAQLVQAIRSQIGEMARDLLEAADIASRTVTDIVLVGNTVMHHLFSDIPLEPLSHYPFNPARIDMTRFESADLEWTIPGNPPVRFLPCLGGFVGSDILAGILATRIYESTQLVGLVDLGTNGEIVIGNRERLLCCSTAAGPAFEGARIHRGMRASTGAIAEVHIQNGQMVCHILGNVAPRGICGSGLVDAVAASLELGIVGPGGRIAGGAASFMLAPPVALSQTDIRELQLAKGAIAAGIRILLEEFDAHPGDLTAMYLAGAFGNYVNTSSARRIGLMHFPSDLIKPAGNTALLGAKIALFNNGDLLARIAGLVRHVPLSSNPQFQDIYVEEMTFPADIQEDN